MGICCSSTARREAEGSRTSGDQHGKEQAAINGHPHHGHSSARKALPTPAVEPILSPFHPNSNLPTNPSLLRDDDFVSCRDDFSVIDPLSPRHSTCGAAELHAEQTGPLARTTPSLLRAAGQAEPAAGCIPIEEKEKAEGLQDVSSEEADDNGEERSSKPLGCLNLIEVLSARLHSPAAGTSKDADQHLHKPRARSQRRRDTTDSKPTCGVSLSRRDMSKSADECSMCFEDGDGCHYNIRGLDYMKTKLKVLSGKSIYRLAAADMFTFDHKQSHIAKLVNLPPAPPAVHQMSPSSSTCYPPLLIINLQLPTYAPSFFGGTDGPGWSIVYYFTLPDDFDPELFPNKKALGLLRRFVQNGKEHDGSATRDRFKIIPRVVNVDEWAQTGPLSSAEHKLLSGYNEKPVLSRPQHSFFHEANYFEVDLDIHTYSYMARSALMSFMSRLKSIIFEIAFVIQGNGVDELPEQVLGCGRISRSDFAAQRPFSSFVPRAPAAAEPHVPCKVETPEPQA